ncbi:MAG: serpin family protein [Rhodoferax sp.]|nr:serpin family protein [Rhodoferax sp.]
MKTPDHFKLGRIAACCLLTLASAGIGNAQTAQETKEPEATAAPTAAEPTQKDIVMDAVATPPAATPPRTSGTLVPTPPRTQPATTTNANATATPAARRYAAAAHNAATAGTLAELALDLMRQQSSTTGNAQVNAVVSPLSLVSALGMVYTGTAGASASELATLLGTASAGERVYTARLPVLLDELTKPGATSAPFVMANRVWLDGTVAKAVPPSYASMVSDRFNADASIVSFAQSAAARKTINGWVAQKTANRIPELMPDGSITSSTKLVVTNAIHFKSKWEKPFDPALTAPKPFKVSPNAAAKPVPTMVDERQVRLGTIDNITVMELPFAGDQFSLMIGVPPAGHTLDAFEKDLEGLDIASWSEHLKPTTCKLALPRFSIEPASKPLKASLQALGVKTVFGPDADFEPMLGKVGKGVVLDNVYQSATIIIDEQGGEAAAATGATAVSKSFTPPAPSCAVDRPFIFAIVHRATGAPLFVGKIADPTQH